MAQTGPGAAPADREPKPTETVAYIAALTKELAGMARQSHLEVVAYLLDIVQLEARRTLSRSQPGPPDQQAGPHVAADP